MFKRSSNNVEICSGCPIIKRMRSYEHAELQADFETLISAFMRGSLYVFSPILQLLKQRVVSRLNPISLYYIFCKLRIFLPPSSWQLQRNPFYPGRNFFALSSHKLQSLFSFVVVFLSLITASVPRGSYPMVSERSQWWRCVQMFSPSQSFLESAK